MARQVETPVVAVAAGATIPEVAANALGHEFANDGGVKMIVRNAGGGSITMTMLTPQVVGEEALAVASLVVTIPGTTSKAIGPFSPAIYDALAQFDFSGVSGISFYLIR
jgi:hypothetical protein